MKKIAGITRAMLDSILTAYAKLTDLVSYVTTTALNSALSAYVLSTDLAITLAHYATQSWTNSQIAQNHAAFLSAFAQKDNVQYFVVKKVTDEPSGAGTENDLNLYVPVAGPPEIWEYTSSWAKLVDLAENNRVLNDDDHTIYAWPGGAEFETYTLQNNDFVPIDNGPVLRFNGSALVEFPIVQSGQLANDELLGIQGSPTPLTALNPVASQADLANAGTVDEIDAILGL